MCTHCKLKSPPPRHPPPIHSPSIAKVWLCYSQGFSSGKNFANPPHPTLVPVFGPSLAPPPAEVRPQKSENFRYIFVSNLTTFKLITHKFLKSCISCLK